MTYKLKAWYDPATAGFYLNKDHIPPYILLRTIKLYEQLEEDQVSRELTEAEQKELAKAAHVSAYNSVYFRRQEPFKV